MGPESGCTSPGRRVDITTVTGHVSEPRVQEGEQVGKRTVPSRPACLDSRYDVLSCRRALSLRCISSCGPVEHRRSSLCCVSCGSHRCSFLLWRPSLRSPGSGFASKLDHARVRHHRAQRASTIRRATSRARSTGRPAARRNERDQSRLESCNKKGAAVWHGTHDRLGPFALPAGG